MMITSPSTVSWTTRAGFTNSTDTLPTSPFTAIPPGLQGGRLYVDTATLMARLGSYQDAIELDDSKLVIARDGEQPGQLKAGGAQMVDQFGVRPHSFVNGLHRGLDLNGADSGERF